MLKKANIGIVRAQSFKFAFPPDELALDSGQRLGPVTLAYETYGRLNREKNNAVLVAHALSGDAHAAGMYTHQDKKNGWWNTMIGPGKAFDTDRFFVICSNVLGGYKGSQPGLPVLIQRTGSRTA
ncbi:MAG: hypothetical protein WC335_09750 [Candidatus Omnitrophota bacterium]|jgi:homoserine O-acetyltransferase